MQAGARLFSRTQWIAAAAWLFSVDAVRFATRFADGEEGEYGTWAADQIGGAFLVAFHSASFAALTLLVGVVLRAVAARWSRPVALIGPAFGLGIYLASGSGVQRIVPVYIGAVIATAVALVALLAAWWVLETLHQGHRTRWRTAAQILAMVLAAALLVVDQFYFWGLYLPLHLVLVGGSTGLVAIAAAEAVHTAGGGKLITTAAVAAVLGIAAVPIGRSWTPAAHTRATTDGTGALQDGRIWYALKSLQPRPPAGTVVAVSQTPIPLAPAVRPHVVVVSVDGVRFDRTSLGGYERDTTPWLTRLASNAWVYERAYSPASNTHDTLTRLFAADESCTPEAAGMFADARAQGYRTFCDFAYSRASLACFASGCDAVADSQDRAVSFRAAAEELTVASEPVFVFLHLLETHRPYRGFDDRVAAETAGWSDYDRAVRGADAAFAEFYRRVEASTSRPVLWVFTSDHGEALGERGHRGHDSSVFAEQTWVPLLIHARNLTPLTVTDPVSLSWLRPTLLATIGMDVRGGLPDRNTDGAGRAAFASNRGWNAVARGSWRYVTDDTSGAAWLFDINTDPSETKNRSAEFPQIAADLATILADDSSGARTRP